MYFLTPYATQVDIYFPMIKRGVLDFAVSADWTPAAGDVLVSIDGAADANATNLPTAPASTSALWKITVSAAQTTGKLISIRIVDLSGPKVIEDQSLWFMTYGNASAAIVRDLGADPQNANITKYLGTAVPTADTAGYPKVTVKSGTGTGEVSLSSGLVTLAGVTHTGAVVPTVTTVSGNVSGNVVGSVGSVTGAVGSVTGAVGSVTGSVGSVVAAVAITSDVKQNQALLHFEFLMTDSTNHNPVTGKTVTGTRSVDGGAFAAGTLANPVEVGNGIYAIDFGAGDLNGKVIILRVTAAGCDDTFERIVTAP